MLFPAQSIGLDQPSLHSSGQLSHHTKKGPDTFIRKIKCKKGALPSHYNLSQICLGLKVDNNHEVNRQK